MPIGVKCKKCLHFRNEWCNKTIDSPDPNVVRDCQYYSTATKGDRIRNMTDEELADELLDWYAALLTIEWTREKIIELLRQEAADDEC